MTTGSNWFSRLSRGSTRHTTADSSASSFMSSQLGQSSHQSYGAYLGKHRKILTPRCDPLLVVRMERANAVVLLQRCLRGKAAQITMADTRSRVLELYPELNQLEEPPASPEHVDTLDDLGAVRAMVAKQLFNLLSSMQMKISPLGTINTKSD
ncbi:hypothetical protein KP509_02G035700 [Ceratopteris richardii]|nr:hypothetical protein KP509_02G035700 [Ceratopteris richardii]